MAKSWKNLLKKLQAFPVRSSVILSKLFPSFLPVSLQRAGLMLTTMFWHVTKKDLNFVTQH